MPLRRLFSQHTQVAFGFLVELGYSVLHFMGLQHLDVGHL